MFLQNQKLNLKKESQSCNRLLISVTVLGSPGPIRLIVDEDALVVSVIDAALRSYSQQGRRPVLGSDVSDFLLYCPSNAGSGSDLSPLDKIGSLRARNFVLYKKKKKPSNSPEPVKKLGKDIPVSCRGRWTWRTLWLKRSRSRVSDEQTALSFAHTKLTT